MELGTENIKKGRKQRNFLKNEKEES